MSHCCHARTRVALVFAGLAAGIACAPFSHAVDYYLGADLAYTRIPVASREFEGFGAKLRLGAMLWKGWGVEVQSLAGFGSDTVADLELGLDNASAVFARYETPQGADYQFFILAGFATTSLSLSGPGTAGLDDRYDGFAWSLGAQERLKRWPNTKAVVEFTSFLGDSNVDVWSLSAGVRYEF